MTIIQKPKFEEVIAFTTMTLPEFGLQFNAQRVGPTNFAGLRNADYGSGFRMPTMPQLIPLVYASLENREYQTAKSVVQTLRQYGLKGNTGILYTDEGMFVQDNPKMRGRRIVMNEKKLEAKLGSKEEKGVVFSKDKSVRFTPYGFKRESQSASRLSQNSGVIAFSGSVENAELLASSSKHYRINPQFWAFFYGTPLQISVAGLSSGGFAEWLSVIADDVLLSEDSNERYSFGVRELKQGESK